MEDAEEEDSFLRGRVPGGGPCASSSGAPMSVTMTAGILLGLQASPRLETFPPAVGSAGPGCRSLSCLWPCHVSCDRSPASHVQARVAFSVGPGQALALAGCTSILSLFSALQQGTGPEGIPGSTSGAPGCAAWLPPSRPCDGVPVCKLWLGCRDTPTAGAPLGGSLGSVEPRLLGVLSPSWVSVGFSGLSPAPGTLKPGMPLGSFPLSTFPQGSLRWHSALSGAGLVSEPSDGA